MWIVRLALRRPYSIAVICLLIAVLGVLSLSRMITDIFPAVNIPVVLVIWNYPGLTPQEMESRVVIVCERTYSSQVSGMQKIESESIPGIGLLRIYFQPDSDIGSAISQVTAASVAISRLFPPGIAPPTVLQFNASNLPVTQIDLSSPTLSEQQVYDYGQNFLRIRLFAIPGLTIPTPFGGKQRQIMVELNPQAMESRGLSPTDIVSALQTSNVITPAGTARIGKTEYNVLLNTSPSVVDDFKQIPVKVVGGAPVLLDDVAKVSDSFAVQQNIVHIDGRRAAYVPILKHAESSTIAVVNAVREVLSRVRAEAPAGLRMAINFDQSVFVRAAIQGVVREAVLAAILVSLMVIIFLGSWRSMVIVISSIPLAILTSIIGLNLAGDSMNIMTLGGLALSVGMLVDDATVTIESIHRNLEMGKEMMRAILDGAQQVAVPAIVSTLSIVIVFFPVVLLFGVSKYLFTPLARAVVFAMLASYVLSRTLVPVLARKLLLAVHPRGEGRGGESRQDAGRRRRGWIARLFGWLNDARDRGFDHFRNAFGWLLEIVLSNRAVVLIVVLLLVIVSAGLIRVIGIDFFPSADVGIMKLHFRAPLGTRIEETDRLTLQVEDRIRQLIPAGEMDAINDNIGLPAYWVLGLVRTENIGGMDAEIMISLKPHHHPTAAYRSKLREVLPREFPGSQFWFESADIVTQVLNFGVSAPIDVQVEGNDFTKSYPVARQLAETMRTIPGAVDVHIPQALDYPALHVDVDRVRAAEVGLTQRDVANNMLVSLASSVLVSPNFYLNPLNNVNYSVAVQVPIQRITSARSLLATPLTAPGQQALLQPAGNASLTALPGAPTGTLSSIASVSPGVSPGEISHYMVQRVLDVEANVDGRDLGSVVRDIQGAISRLGKLPVGMRIFIRGQSEVMDQSFRILGLGLVLAVLLVYFLIVVLFQSWIDPFIIILAVPGALMGILWMLALTGTTANVESLMGSIMAVGIAVANSILLVSYANDQRVERGLGPVEAALEAAKIRLRPVLMTALAMILGMLPMAMSMGEAGEQNAPLGRAVIGGLIVATFTTLFVVPIMYSLFRREMPSKHLLDEQFLREERGEAAP